MLRGGLRQICYNRTQIQRLGYLFTMPLYEYKCASCGNVFEVIQKFSDEPLHQHPGCGGAVERLISAPSLQFKGSGWYVNDYGRNHSSGREKSNSQDGKSPEGKSDAKASDGKSTDATKNGGAKTASSSDSAASSTTKTDK